MKWKILRGYVENRTKETALAAMMLALFFVSRTFTIPLGLVTIDFSGAIIMSAASALSWPFTIVFSLATFYLGSNVFGTMAFLVGTQIAFFTAKSVRRSLVPHTPGVGTLAGMLTYGLLLHSSGIMSFSVYVIALSIPIVFACVSTYLGGLLFWRAFKYIGFVLDE